MIGKTLALALLAFSSAPSSADPYVIANRLIPERLRIYGLSGLYPEGCDSGSTSCSNIVINGVVERIDHVDGEDFPSLIRVREYATGRRRSIKFPYEEIWDKIGTSDSSWIAQWLHPGDRVTIIGVIGGSAGEVTIDSIYLTSYLQGHPGR